MKNAIRVPTFLFALIMVCVLITACGGSSDEPAAPAVADNSSTSATEEETEPAPEPAPEPEPTPEPEPMVMADDDSVAGGMSEAASGEETGEAEGSAVVVNADGVAEVTIGSTDTMQFTVRAFTVEAGQEVELTLIHEGNLPIEVMGHNVVILPQGDDYVAFAQQVMANGGAVANDYLPESLRDGLIAHTSLIGGGETDTIRFTAPDEPGEYPFLCSFPGHFGVMNGIMTVL